MGIQDFRFKLMVISGFAKSSGMGKLQADAEIVRVPAFSMCTDQGPAQISQRRHGILCDHELIGICTPLRQHGSRFTTPDQLGTAVSEPLPPPCRQFCWATVRGTVPPFHRLNAQAVADGKTALQCTGLCQRCIRTRLTDIIKLELNP